MSSFIAWIKELDSLESLNVDKAELKQQLKTCQRQLEEVKVYARGAVFSLNQLFLHADLNERKSCRIKEGLRKGDYSSLNDYLLLVKVHARKSTERFREFEEAYRVAVELCNETAQTVEVKRQEAENLLAATQTVGGTVAGILL